MQEDILTLEILSSDFGLSIDEMAKFAKNCGISCSVSKPLSEDEINALYDAYVAGDKEIKMINHSREKMIFFDTCSLLESNSAVVLKNIASKLLNEGRKMIIPYIVIKELRDVPIKKKWLSKRAEKIMKIISHYRKLGTIAIYGDENDVELGFADAVIQKLATMFAQNYEFIVITQDNNLTSELLNMANSQSVRYRRIKVFKINNNGKLVRVVSNLR